MATTEERLRQTSIGTPVMFPMETEEQMSQTEAVRNDPMGNLASGITQTNENLNAFTPTPTEVTAINTTPEQFLDPNQFATTTEGQAQATAAEAATVDQNLGDVTAPTPVQAALVDQDAMNIEGAEGVAVERELQRGELVSEQIADLTAGLESGNIPVWAQAAVANVDRQLAARGISRSSIGQAELTNAILQSALPIAQANAQALQRRSEINLSNAQQTMLQNMTNEQQAGILTAQLQQQTLLSNQAAENATRQFNASSQQQTDQFMSQMRTSIAQNNAARVTAVSQFNAGQTNAITQFNEEMRQRAEQFNSQMASVIAQANVQWRRQVSTANTAAQNQANFLDSQQRFGLDSQALSNRWQAARDLASWAFASQQNAADHAAQLAIASMQTDSANDAAATNAIGTIIGYGIKAFDDEIVAGAKEIWKNW